MTKDIGYMAQRSTNPNLVLDFLNALPPGTLESGVSMIPDLDVKKKFKLSSPSMTKALIKLGVHPDVVSGYYSAFDANRVQRTAKVYHITTFPQSSIMRQQSDSDHFSSCMSSGYEPSGDRGSYYDDYIGDDISAYEAGDIGLLVVGSHARDIEAGDITYAGDGRGFIARAKIRILYKVRLEFSDIVSTRRAALFIDHIYGNREHLISLGLPEIVKWNNETYKLPIVVNRRTFEMSKTLKESDISHEPGDDNALYYLHDGYNDYLASQSGYSIAGRGDYRTIHALFYNGENAKKWGVVHPGMPLSQSLQLKAYLRAQRNRCDKSFVNEVPVSQSFVERASDKIINRAEVKKKDWRYGWLLDYDYNRPDRGRVSRFLQSRAYVDRLLQPALTLLLKERIKSERFETTPRNNGTAFRVTLSDDFQVSVRIYPGVHSLDLSIDFCQSDRYEDITHMPEYYYRFGERYSFNYVVSNGCVVSLEPFSRPKELSHFYHRCSYNFDPSPFANLSSNEREATLKPMYDLMMEMFELMKKLGEIPIDNPRKVRYNVKRVKKLIGV